MGEPEQLRRDLRRARERGQRRQRGHNGGLTARQSLESWRRECHVTLVRQASRLGLGGLDLDLVADRKKLCITLSREQAALAGVSNAEWACARRDRRAALIEAAVGRGSR